jgi:hypothetical protein
VSKSPHQNSSKSEWKKNWLLILKPFKNRKLDRREFKSVQISIQKVKEWLFDWQDYSGWFLRDESFAVRSFFSN